VQPLSTEEVAHAVSALSGISSDLIEHGLEPTSRR